MPDYTCDLLVIGAGPAGCTAALYGARARLTTVLSSPSELSGMMSAAPWVANFPGQIDAIPGRDILARLRTQALQAGAEHILESVSGVDFGDPGQFIVYGGHQEHRARAVIIATGATGRSKKAPGEEEFLGRGVCYCAACDGPFFAGEDVLVVGDDAQAAEEALTLARIARTVHLVTAASKLKVDPSLLQVITGSPNLEVHSGLKLQVIVGDEAVTGAIFRGSAGEEHFLNAAGVFLYLHGNAPATDFLAGVVAADEQGYLLTDELFQTSVPGVFAAGDVRRKLVRQMVVAAGEGASAALAAERHVHKTARVRLDTGLGAASR